jgi:diketogulonate reductase-like aldo/keto reductase
LNSADVFVSARGTRVPLPLYGTAWKKERTAGLVERALSLGFRGIDTACQPKHYDEAGVGAGVAASLERGLRRQELYLQTKFTPLSGQDPKRIPYDPKAGLAEQVPQSCAVSLRQLGTTYLDCLVLHSPVSPFRRWLEVWRAMEALVERGAVRELGISNCYALREFEALYGEARIKPLVLQNRFYAKTGYDRELRAFCLAHGILYQSFWTLTANGALLSQAPIDALARQYAVTPAQVLLRGLTQLGMCPLTGTSSEQHMRDDLRIFEFALSAAELARLEQAFSIAAAAQSRVP